MQAEELNIIKEDTQEEVQEYTKPKTKTNYACSALNENTTCPVCGITLTMHGLKYTHKRFCKAKPKVVGIEDMPQPPPSSPPPPPPGLVRQKTSIDNVESLQALVPTPEQIPAFLSQERK